MVLKDRAGQHLLWLRGESISMLLEGSNCIKEPMTVTDSVASGKQGTVMGGGGLPDNGNTGPRSHSKG